MDMDFTREDIREDTRQIVASALEEVTGLIRELIQEMSLRFEQVDARFEQIDIRFEQIDRRFEEVDDRFRHIEDQLTAIKSDTTTLSRITRAHSADIAELKAQ